MCPPANPPPLSEIGLYWSDEQIITFLDKYTPASHLPSNVLGDSNPYGYPPSNLPEGIWYLVHPNHNKESIHGFWKARNEACKIYSNSMITGWRKTLQYFEGQAPPGQRTDWFMQEYSVTREGLSDKVAPQDSRLLCRVFPCSGYSSKNEMHSQNSKVDTELKKISMEQSMNIISSRECRNESQATRVKSADEKSNSSPSNLSEHDCIRSGDYLELDDLEDQSIFSSSKNSSCPSNLSDECFDPSALLKEIEEDENKINESKQTSSGYTFSTSAKPNDVVLQPASVCMSGRIELKGPRTGSPIPERFTEKRLQEHSTEMQVSDSRTEGTSKPSTSRKNAMPSQRKKPTSDRIKQLKKYLCLNSF